MTFSTYIIGKGGEEVKKNGSNAENTIKTTIILGLFGILIVVAFYLLSNRTDKIAENAPKRMTAVQEVLSRNLETNYPATPKELLKFYSEITRCFYGEEFTDEELTELADKSRELFDDELLHNQTDAQYLSALKADIASYKESKKSISSYSVSNSTDVDYYTYDGYDWAQLYCIYSIRVSTQINPVQEHFLLRKDPVGHWKIVGWQIVEDNDE